MSTLDLSTMSAVEIAAALSAGKTDIVTIVAHLATRKLGDSLADIVPLLPLMGEYTATVMLSQQALHQKKETAPKREPIKRVSGSRNINVLPPVERDDGEKGNCWQLTSCRSGWRWIVAHAAEISAACDEADKADAMAIARELAEKLRKKAEKEAAAPK